MPLIKRYKHQDSEIILWEIIEDYSYFQNKLNFSPEDMDRMSNLTNKRLIEWLMPRYILSTLLDMDHRQYYKDEYGKPHLPQDAIHISISHSGKYFAFIHSPYNCGIDIQCFNSKIELIKRKFVNDHEEKWLKNIKDQFLPLHVIWSAKEAIYKAYGRKQISLKGNIFLADTILKEQSTARLKSKEVKKDYHTYNMSNTIYSLIYATETN